MAIVKSGSARWEGGLKDGNGTVSTQSGAIEALPYGFNTRFGDTPGTNPEELIGAAHAACFSMALSARMGEAGITPERIETTSKITLDRGEGGFVITKAHLVTHIKAPADAETILALAKEAEKGCPVSKVLNAEISIEASVV